jgi:hypothetical protein
MRDATWRIGIWITNNGLDGLKDEPLWVVKMKFPRREDPQTGKSVADKTAVIYNQFITVRDIPLAAYN